MRADRGKAVKEGKEGEWGSSAGSALARELPEDSKLSNSNRQKSAGSRTKRVWISFESEFRKTRIEK